MSGEIVLSSPQETEAWGRRLASQWRGGECIALVGDLGAGKTQLVKGMVAGLGCDESATSPTFTLVNEYHGGRLPLYHFDFYRLQSAAEVEGIGFAEYLDSGGVCVVEWADRFPELIDPGAWWINFKMGSAERRHCRLEKI